MRSMTKIKRIKLFAIFSEENKVLKEQWFSKSLKDDFDLYVRNIGQISDKDVNHRDSEWYRALKAKIFCINQAIQENMGDVIVFSDVDIQFFRKTELIIKACLKEMTLFFKVNIGPSTGKSTRGLWLSDAMRRPEAVEAHFRDEYQRIRSGRPKRHESHY